MKTHQVRRAKASLGLFNERELRALVQKGKLLPTDEVDDGAGKWIDLGAYMAALPASGASAPQAAEQQASIAPVPVRHFYLHAGGKRIGPLEHSKISGMAQAGLVDATAMLEDVSLPGHLDPIDKHVQLTPQAAKVAAPASVVTLNRSASVTKSTPTPATPAKSKVSYLNLWWKTSLWIYGIGAVFGYLAGNLSVFIAALLLGLLLAPIKGAFWAWIIWLFKR